MWGTAAKAIANSDGFTPNTSHGSLAANEIRSQLLGLMLKSGHNRVVACPPAGTLCSRRAGLPRGLTVPSRLSDLPRLQGQASTFGDHAYI